MPSFENIEVTLSETINVEFEVYCGTCGAGLCSETSTRSSRTRGYQQVTVNACPDCMERKDREISELKDEIYNLESKLFLKDTLTSF